MRRSSKLVWGLLSVSAVVLSACGTRVSDAEFAARQGPSTGAGARGPAAQAEAEGAMFGTLPIPCSPGPEDRSAFGDTDEGVTADAIRIATIADPGGLIPGLNQGVFDSMEAFAAWCNDLGGINGRRLELELIDAEILKYNEAVAQACESAFALVGSLGVQDNLGTRTQLECGLPNIPAAAVNPEQTGADLTFQALPNPPWVFKVSPGQWVAEEHPEAIDKAGMIYTNLPTTQMQADRQVEAYEQIGYTFVATTAAAFQETNWGPTVTDLKNRGVTYVSLSSSPEELVPLAKEMARQDFSPVVELEANFYADKLPVQADGTADGFYVRTQTWPLEEPEANSALASYLDIMETYQPGGVLEYLGLQAFSAALYWAAAASSAGPDLTRDALIAELEKIDRWDGGGIQAPTNPSALEGSPCFIMLKIVTQRDDRNAIIGGYERAYPRPDEHPEIYDNDEAPGYACPEEGFVEVDDQDYRSMGLTLEDVGG